MLLNNQWITEEIKKKYLETNHNENMTIQNLWDTAKKTVLRGKFIAIQSYLRTQEKQPQINNLTLCLKQLEKEVWTKLSKLVDEKKS